jgi:hypothetical protein
MTMTPDLSALFVTDRFAVWRSLFDTGEQTRLYSYAMMRADAGTMSLADPQVRQTPSAGGDFIMDGVLADLAPRVEAATTLSLFPTYSFFRVYKCGDVLARHTDRPACEISLTVCLGFTADETWPIWIEGPRETARVALEPGDAVLYRGIECPHWREALTGASAAQLFLHYVDRNGPYAEWKFDKREKLTDFPFRTSADRPAR